ncbi:ABC transporter substrate-binding protein [Arthrobacter sp. CDRTa11]|uniref:ABC transporter substrate-binding protein n=1 Tax=Arthrobacter sp. CDRTa11 TaxID=2651199 RepID=UPI002265A774|nr:ABC transporter substrate-binding protein [Arthrobacter sp. CDRTa11]UZX01695.1 ABC transporter substrate-binding protein [Arthrobacter sp. CDRTa11]
MRYPRSSAALALFSALALTGCGTAYPADPSGTLGRVTDGTLRVGASSNADWVEVSSGGGDVSDEDVQGSEAELVRRFAAKLGAEIDWVSGTEYVLAEDLKRGNLDLVIGGLDDKTPWSTHAGLTMPYTESVDGHGSRHRHVMLVPMGENAFLLELDSFLKEAGAAQ